MYQSFLKPLFSDLKTFVLDTLFPIACLSCGKEGGFLCYGCSLNLTEVDGQICIVCKKPSLGGLTHPLCKTPHGADGLISFFDYHDDLVSKLIIKGKYYFLKDVFMELGELIAQKIKTDHPHLLQPTTYNLKPILIPIPLHSRRRRWRGFNQAEILCHALSKELGFEVCGALIRLKSTKIQKDLKKDQRVKNVADAFALNPNLKSYILNHNLLLVDDVATTGATLLEACKVLKRSGAKAVWCLTFAKD